MKTDPFYKVFSTLENTEGATDEQKKRMLNRILSKENSAERPLLQRIEDLIFNNPWQTALSLSIAQTVVLTVCYGANYTNFVLNLIGGR